MPDFANLDLKSDLYHALAQLHKKLPPTERAVFVLKEIFNFEYSELTEILGKKADNCRQLLSRAQKRLGEETERFTIDTDRIVSAVTEFKNAALGEFSDLIEGLKKDMGK